ncbi:MAG TPA: c-type cytochrome [Puia sp.]|jgi:mono/diheme cytochrome c family protein|nr:c-type cytochrome [Puia sp.]
MKKVYISTLIIVAVTLAVSCSDVQRDPGRVYMPDMAYSRAYETYATTDELKKELLGKGIHFSNTPVEGTIKRGELLPFLIRKDSVASDSVNYHAAREVKNPLTSMDTVEAERLYLVNCGICHGPKLDGNGPLYKGGDGPFPVAPANLASGAQYVGMPEGQMFYSVTYGKNKMGSYASQLNTEQRWMVIAYIKSKQSKPRQATAAGSGTTAAGGGSAAAGHADSTAAKK